MCCSDIISPARSVWFQCSRQYDNFPKPSTSNLGIFKTIQKFMTFSDHFPYCMVTLYKRGREPPPQRQPARPFDPASKISGVISKKT